jgi:hypothetical protein
MKRLRVLDGQVMQPEAPLYLGKLLGIGLDQSYPDETILGYVTNDLGGDVEVKGSFQLTPTVTVVGAIDNHADPPLVAFR